MPTIFNITFVMDPDIDFEKDDAVILPSAKTPSVVRSPCLSTKYFTVQITLALFLQTTGKDAGKHYPVAILGVNFYLLRYLLILGNKLPNGEIVKACTSLVYPDVVKRTLEEIQFSESALERFPEEELRSASWHNNATVTTMFACSSPVDLMETFDSIQSLDGEIVTPPRNVNANGERFKIRVKVHEHKVIAPCEIFVLKYFAQKTIRDRANAPEKITPAPSPAKRSFDIIGASKMGISTSEESIVTPPAKRKISVKK